MDVDFKAQSLEAWRRLKKLSDEERKIVLANVQATLLEGMALPPEELEIFKKYGKGELSMEQVLESVREWIAQFQEINGEEELKRLLQGV
ncbi:MAG: antitoxin VbhA family protein [Desulfosporosinus sp.]|nr:antitoxin VbhA family protein [Desulfosporosinus sp.]